MASCRDFVSSCRKALTRLTHRKASCTKLAFAIASSPLSTTTHSQAVLIKLAALALQPDARETHSSWRDKKSMDFLK